MYALARPLLFTLSPSLAHALGMLALAPLEYVAPLRALVRAVNRPDPRSKVRALGLDFPSVVGLAGGFDKNATRARALAALGFGFVELGTVTARAQAPNPTPNMFRLPADRAIVNRLGFPNEGARAVAKRFVARGGLRGVGVPVAFSIGKSRAVEITDDPQPVIEDYLESFRHVAPVCDFVVVNVSSPNTANLRALQGPLLAHALLSALVQQNDLRRPILLKIAPDLGDTELDALLEVVGEVGLAGIVATNTTIARAALSTTPERVREIGAGGLSGPPLATRAREVVARARAKLGMQATIIGVGGVSTGEDALAMMDAGADLVQLYTAFVYRGPSTPKRVERELLAARSRRELTPKLSPPKGNDN